MHYIHRLLGFLCFTMYSLTNISFGEDIQEVEQKKQVKHISNFSKIDSENKLKVVAFRYNYLMPYYYSDKPDQANFQAYNPNEKKPISSTEVKFQISAKTLIIDFPSANVGIYGAYTQQSYWQTYQSSAYFRETNYQPEIFLSLLSNQLFWGWNLIDTEIGFVHQSNGLGGDRERSWNRIYARQIVQKNNWQLEATISNRLKDHKDYNPNIEKYLGHDNFVIEYRTSYVSFSLELRNQISSGFRRGAETLSISFPLSQNFPSFCGFIQFFSGYGQCLSEYNHHNNSVGIGVCLSGNPFL